MQKAVELQKLKSCEPSGVPCRVGVKPSRGQKAGILHVLELQSYFRQVSQFEPSCIAPNCEKQAMTDTRDSGKCRQQYSLRIVTF